MLREMLANNPGDSFLQHAMALELVKAGDDAAAAKVFEALLGANPDYVGSYYHLGKLYERKGDSMQALEWYEKGMEVARSVGDMHAFGELRAAADNLEG